MIFYAIKSVSIIHSSIFSGEREDKQW